LFCIFPELIILVTTLGTLKVVHTGYSPNIYLVTGFNIRYIFFFLVELLDEEEFGEAAEARTYDEEATNSAMELGLLVGKVKFKK